MGKVRQIFVWNGQQDLGPFRRDELVAELTIGHVRPSAYYYEEGMADWERIAQLPCCQRILASDAQKQMLDRMGVTYDEFLTKRDVSAILEHQPATDRQLVLMRYLNIEVPPVLTKTDASNILENARSDPSLGDRFYRWNTERFDLHPDLYAPERATYKAGRASCLLEQYNEFRREVKGFPKLSLDDLQQIIAKLDNAKPEWDHDLLATGVDHVIAELEKTGRA
jgi:hypothetical protein